MLPLDRFKLPVVAVLEGAEWFDLNLGRLRVAPVDGCSAGGRSASGSVIGLSEASGSAATSAAGAALGLGG